MNNRKLRFNFIDLIILLVIGAVVAVLLYVFVFSDKSNAQVNETEYTKITYEIEVLGIDSKIAESVAGKYAGVPVTEVVQRRAIGNVVEISLHEYNLPGYNNEIGAENYSTVSNKNNLVVTIEAQAIESDRAFTVDGYEIRVGQLISFFTPEFQGYGYCITLTDGKTDNSDSEIDAMEASEVSDTSDAIKLSDISDESEITETSEITEGN